MSLRRFLRRYGREHRGSAAVEYALWLAALSPPIFGAADIGYYGYQVIQVHNAAQMAMQSAFSACASTTQFPATKDCGSKGANLNAAIANGEHSTALGTNVTMSSGSEKWMCQTATGLSDLSSANDGTINTTNGDVDTSGNDTAATFPATFTCGTSTNEPGDYIVATFSYTFKPLFKGFSVVNLLGGNSVTITQTAYTRLE